MRGKQRLLVNALHYSGVLEVLRHTAGTNQLIVFNYHRLRPRENFTAEFDDGVFGPTVQQFKEQITWLQQNTHILSETELIERIETPRAPAKRSVMITFDDGYRDNYELAFPILKELGVPAIFFIPTQSITERRLGWWDLIAYLIKQTNQPAIAFDGQLIDRAAAIPFFLQKMKLEKHENTQDLLTKLARACNVPLPERELQDAQLMTWEQVREVSRHKIAIGSHTHTHRVLATIPPAVQRAELSTSKAALESELGTVVRSLSYPVGHYRHFTADTQSITADCGYAVGFSFNTGVNDSAALARYDIKRVSAPEAVEMIAAMTLLPPVFAKPKRTATWQNAGGN